MKLDEKVVRDVINILDNLVYWDTCPKEYKEEIPDLIKALNMHIVVRQSEKLFCECAQAKGCDIDEDGHLYCIECQKNIAAK